MKSWAIIKDGVVINTFYGMGKVSINMKKELRWLNMMIAILRGQAISMMESHFHDHL